MKTIPLLLLIGCLLLGCESTTRQLCEGEAALYTHHYAGLEVFGTLDDALQCALIQQKPVLLVFSGFACVGDRRYEKRLFEEAPNHTLIAEHFVPVILFVDDKKKLPPAEIITVEINGKKRVIETFGDQNLLFQQQLLASNSQPQLIILDHLGQPITDPIWYRPSPDDYHDFLQEGLLQYRKRSASKK